jgi:hypothetical protein
MTEINGKIQVPELTIVSLMECSRQALNSLRRIEGLRVNGYLNLAGCVGLKELPRDLRVKEGLILRDTTTEIPRDLIVGEILNLSYCKGIKKLPEGLTVGAKIWYNSHTGFFKHKDEPGVIPDHLRDKLKMW